RDEDHVALVDGLEVLGCSWIVHDPRVDEDLFALGAACLPCAMTDPRERHRVIECHQEILPQAVNARGAARAGWRPIRPALRPSPSPRAGAGRTGWSSR